MLMMRVWGHLGVGLLLLASAVVSIPACAHDDSTLFVQNVLLAAPVSAGQVCQFTNDPKQPSISSGILDLALRDQYDAEFLLGNQMVSEANSQQLQTETSIITIQGAVVRITDAAGAQINTFTRLTSATIYPAAGSVPGYGAVGVTILDSSSTSGNGSVTSTVTGGGSARLVTYVKFFGVTLGGKSVESDEFEFPVDICLGCLISFSPVDISPLFAAPNCRAAGSGTVSSLPVPCIVGQDTAVDCSYCLTNPYCNPSTAPIADAGAGG
jgi:hypothetical protein